MRLLRGELRKLFKRPASRITLILQLAIILLIYLAVAASYKALADAPTTPDAQQSRAGIRLLLTFPGAYAGVLGLITGLGGLLAIGYGASAAGADWGWGMVKVAIARGESRSRYILAKLVAVLLLVGLGFLISFVVGVVVAILASAVAGISLAGVSDSSVVSALPEQLLRGFWGVAEEATIGFAIATFARSQLAGLGAGIALYFVESFATLFLADIVRYLPFHVASSALRVTTNGGGPGGGGATLVPPLDPNFSLVLVTVYLLVAAVATAVIVERAEITG
jgi:ABC-type transport system involved in multi-copper enzyme maturation permease subunit